MERLIYIVDTNAVGDYLNNFEPTTEHIRQAIRDNHDLYLCQPVYYEVMRGLIKTQSMRKQQMFEQQFAPQLLRLPLEDTDWEQAAEFWAQTKNAGQQLSDTDLLIAALTKRLDAVLVTADNDFDSLPIKRENWRTQQ